MVSIGSSIICMDHINFQTSIEHAELLGVDYLHVDIMDGRYVPRYGIYPEIMKRISDVTNLPMDVHLMVEDTEFAIKQIRDISNIELISIHADQCPGNLLRMIDLIHDSGFKAGLVFNLSINFEPYIRLFQDEEIDSIMFMAIHPGVLSQIARPESVIRALKKWKTSTDYIGKLPFIQCDGGVTFDSISGLVASGVNNLVCGSSTLYRGVDFSVSGETQFEIVKHNYHRILEEIKNGQI